MTLDEKLDEMRSDLRWLVNELLKDEADEAANAACAAILAVGEVVKQIHEYGIDESEWNRDAAGKSE